MSGPAAAIPYLLLGDSRRRKLADRIKEGIEAWHRTWLPGRILGADVEVQDLQSRPTDIRTHEAMCFRVHTGEEELLALVVPLRTMPLIVGAPATGADASSRFADERSLAAALEHEALRRLAGSLLARGGAELSELERAPIPAIDMFREHDAARYLTASVTLGESRRALSVLLAPTFVEKLVPRPGPPPDAERVERRRSAAASQCVDVDAVLGMAELPVSELAALAVGDVIVLERLLTDAGELFMREGERLGRVAPGRAADKRAIQIKGRTA